MGKALKMARAALGVGKKGHLPVVPKQKQSQKSRQQQQKGKPVQKAPQKEKPVQKKGREEREKEQDTSQTVDLQALSAPTITGTKLDKTVMEIDSPQSTHPILNPLPIDPTSNVLLFGEGDLSFSLSLHTTHSYTHLTTTTYDPHPVLLKKYPQYSYTITALLSPNPTNPTHHTVLHSIDATSPPKSITKQSGSWDAIIFLFPHTGGLTKDRDRQIRANQELLLGFFKIARGLIEPKKGCVVMGTFTGEPYQSWDIRGLARREGFRVRRSGAFPWDAFPGYHHARTLGNIRSGGVKDRRKEKGAAGGEINGGDGAVGVERKGWKGEDRPARLWIFEVDDGKLLNVPKKKRKRNVPAEFDTDSESEGEVKSQAKKGAGKGGKKVGADAEDKIVAESKQWFKTQVEEGKSSKSKRTKHGDNDDSSGWKDGDVESQEARFRAEDDL
ncbi:hypothetical protein L211DRAFT_835209 [Terfezia boudieri ATCC MYA-4762]|uniref:25S rRNA (uridine-N(3))-methyltransferase BMT5-like domain-containing protein n=1 Tax=Terfezia boudieri ATCC MYA-4762 TaxID=1051890 RepID=A0A3N4LZ60_9PEZI|nr:hypothetical protein L211DRAFT_835209 [Terfezia boudieri ATCC MYA-4762]